LTSDEKMESSSISCLYDIYYYLIIIPYTLFSRCVLALDEVTDPQNLGALIRSFYFLNRNVSRKRTATATTATSTDDDDGNDGIGDRAVTSKSKQISGINIEVSIVLCQKNSAPLSPAVSKASSGALEAMTVHSTKNMMKFLEMSKANGWHVRTAVLALVSWDHGILHNISVFFHAF
jgi:hypothetical protein